ncbi:MAG TPA: MFS transporter [Patescibacteria group bacterium]|nr:MFS transporter [Patescibacteria group bacterium]
MQHSARRYQLQYDGKLNGPLRILLVVSGFFTFAFGMLTPIYALFVEGIGEDITVVADSWAVFSLVAGLLTFVVGKWENKIKETELGIVFSQFILGFAYILFFLTDGILMLYAAMACLGAGMALYWPAFHSTYGKHTTRREAAWQWSLYDGLSYLLPALAAVVGGAVVEAYGFGSMFIVMAVLSFVCGLFVLVLPRKAL